MFVVDLFGRRPLLLASGLVMSTSTAAVGAFFAIDPDKRADIPGTTDSMIPQSLLGQEAVGRGSESLRF